MIQNLTGFPQESSPFVDHSRLPCCWIHAKWWRRPWRHSESSDHATASGSRTRYHRVLQNTTYHCSHSHFLEGSVGEAIVNLWLYFYRSVEGVAYNIIPLKSDTWKKCGLQRYSTHPFNYHTHFHLNCFIFASIEVTTL